MSLDLLYWAWSRSARVPPTCVDVGAATLLSVSLTADFRAVPPDSFAFSPAIPSKRNGVGLARAPTTMNHFAIALVGLCLFTSPVHAQNASHWGVVGGFVPLWKTTSSVEKLGTLVFADDAVELLKGSEFRIGIARGRILSGDWGVSFIRKNFDGQNPSTAEEGRGCQGGSTPGGPVILSCTTSNVVLTPDDLQISGVEVHKFIAFATIQERVQIGLNVAGGVGVGRGGFTTETFENRFTCRFPVGVFPDFSTEDPCAGGTRGPQTVIPTGRGTEPFTRILNYERNLIPLGKLEIAGTVVLTPQLKYGLVAV